MFDLDRSKKAMLTVNCIIRAIDIYGLAGLTSLSMQIYDFNDNPPTFPKSVYGFNILQGNESKYSVNYKNTSALTAPSALTGPQGSWSVHVCCLHLKMEFCSCARGRQWCGIIRTTDEQLQ